jgi:hypothetical protein
MKVEDWEKGIEAWKNVKRQAEIDMEQAEIYIKAIEDQIQKLKPLKKVEK